MATRRLRRFAPTRPRRFRLLLALVAAAWIPWTPAPAQDTGSLTFILSADAELRVVDPQGHGVWLGEYGYGSDITEANLNPDTEWGSGYFDLGEPTAGVYLVEVTGRAKAKFFLGVTARGPGDSFRSNSASGDLLPDQTFAYRLSYPADPDSALLLEKLDEEARRALAARFPRASNPCRETPLISAGWGSAEDQFTEPAQWDGLFYAPGIQGPGPFAVDEQGFIYVLDGPRRRLMRYTPQGAWDRTIPIPVIESTGFEKANDPSITNKGNVTFRFSGEHTPHEAGSAAGPAPIFATELAVAHDVAVWREGSQNRREDERYVRFLDLRAPDTLLCRRYWDLRPDPETDIAHGFEVVRTGDDVRLHDLHNSRSTVIVEGGRILRYGPYRVEPGLEVYPGLRLARLRASKELGTPSTSRAAELPVGRRAMPGDIVRLAPDGSVVGVFAEQSGGILGSDSEGRVLLPKILRGENLDIRSADGTVLSRTPLVKRPWTGEIILGPRRRMGERCFYEIWVERAGLHISRWDLQ